MVKAVAARLLAHASLVGIMVAGAGSGLHAQEAGDTSGEQVEKDNVILVTAQKRSQDVLDVGISISVVGAEAIAARRIESATEIVAFTPNVSVKENVPGLVPVITIRGVGLNDFSATNNPSAGVYVDEVSLSSLALMNFDLFDLERMEVLKGPQGTLYGRNTTAGALNVVSARPDTRAVRARVSASLANYDTKDFEAMINLPLSDTAALRLAGKAIIQDEGFYFNEATGRDIGRREVFLGRAQLLFEPTDTIEALFKAEIQRGRSEIGQPEFFGLAPPVPAEPGLVCPGSPRCTDFFGYRDTDGDPFRGSWSVDPTYDVNQLNLTARISADLGFAELTSVTGYIDFDRVWGIDVDATPLRQTDFVTADDVEQFSQELRLAGETDAVNWLVGGFYSWDRVQSTYDGDLRDLFNTTTFTSSDQKTETAAAFINAEWRLADNLDLITGVRYTWERRSNVGSTVDLVSQAPASFLTTAPFGTPPIPLAVVDDTISDRNWSYKIGLNWSIDDNTLAYASISQGVKSGGFFAGVATNSGQLIPYEPERLVSYEAGIKGRLDALNAVYAVSAFYYDYNNVQTFIRDTVGNLPIQRLGNVDKAEIYGIDGELTFRPSFLPGLDWAVGVGLLESELGAFASSGGAVPAGNRLPDAPTFSFNTLVGYEFDLSSDFAMRFAIDGRYQGLTFKDGLNDPLIAADAFWVLNGRISLMRTDGWDLSLWGKNIADERYVTQGINQLALGTGNRVYGAPRTWGVSIAKTF